MRKFVKIDAQEGCLRAHLFCIKKYVENPATFRYLYLRNYGGDFFQIWYVNLIEIDPIVFKLQ